MGAAVTVTVVVGVGGLVAAAKIARVEKTASLENIVEIIWSVKSI